VWLTPIAYLRRISTSALEICVPAKCKRCDDTFFVC
jgi:hypothetical protein